MKTRIISLSVIVIAALASVCPGMDSKRAPRNPDLLTPGQLSAEVIREAAANQNPLVRMDAVEAVAISREKSLYPLVIELLKDKDDGVRFGAAMAVGDLKYGNAAGFVSDMFESRNQNEKIAAAYALIKLGDNDMDYHKAIVSALQSDDPTVSANAALVMGKLGAKKYIGLLKWALQIKENADEKTQIQSIESLAMLGYKDIDSKAWALMISKRADDRVMGIITMYRLGSYEARNAIKTMLDDDVLEVRIIAAGRLLGLKDNDGIDIIRQFFEEDVKKLSGDDRSRALMHALDAVRFSRNLKLAEYLPPYLDDSDIIVRLHSALAILSLS